MYLHKWMQYILMITVKCILIRDNIPKMKILSKFCIFSFIRITYMSMYPSCCLHFRCRSQLFAGQLSFFEYANSFEYGARYVSD